MPPDREEYLLPSLSRVSQYESGGPQTSWSPFDANQSSSDRSYIRYEPAQQEQDITAHQDAPHGIGLGISRSTGRRPSSIHFRHGSDGARPLSDMRSPSYSDQQTPRSHTSKTPLMDHELPGFSCPRKEAVAQKWYSWVPFTILVLAIYATVGSGLFFLAACWRPRYGKGVGENGHLSPSTANLLSALFAKTIELAYVTVIVAFLGQFLSRRAIKKDSRGITISEMSMRTWIMQPGSMIVHWRALQYSALTLLGAMTLTATLVSMLYTTAAEALVSPKLLMGPLEDTVMSNNVSIKFGNPEFLGQHCSTPVTSDLDPAEIPQTRGTTCLQLHHVSQAYHNYMAYITDWNDIVLRGNSGSTSFDKRPFPTALVNDNTTVTGTWIDQANITELSAQHGRLVINVTAAMPHGGVLAAVTNPVNGIKRPRKSAEGNFELYASIPSPAVNVLCAGMTAKELEPLVYTKFPYTPKWDLAEVTKNHLVGIPAYPTWLNRTVVDDIFGWGEKYNQTPPVFAKLPAAYNTLVNGSVPYGNAVYLLGATPGGTDPPYVVCSLRAKLSPRCSSKYSASYTGANFSTTCDDSNDRWRYDRLHPDAPDGVLEMEWKNIVSEWANAMSLGQGVSDGQSSNARMLMQFVPANTTSLNPKAPSVAEALAVMAGNTLFMGAENAPLVHFWNHSGLSIDKPETQYFSGSMSTVQYQTSSTAMWQEILFYPILGLTFVTSALCLMYLLFEQGRQLTDFTEPQNLFALAINSPATAKMEGSCGAGPTSRHLQEKWYVGMDEGDEHYYIRTKAEENTPLYSAHSPVIEDEGLKPASPAIREYRRLSARRGLLSRWY
ncbi:hypothetical protein BDV25DRAFT_148242 [Aspergillus avenaceus]|uniref:Uncharacterized protein n=1 Tax=Aspergillus avenaceus TaxID=36643 RepID=A0A5N6U6P9_ASPAV|nr:hypothetical protein BDV25DRAFT_148242 [Aspergillus avenaceus]